MVKQGDSKKFVWEIKNFSTLQSETCCSVPVVIGGCKWLLIAYPKGDQVDCLSLYLTLAEFNSIPSGWRKYVKFCLSIVNQLSQDLHVQEEAYRWFDQNSPGWGFQEMLPLTELHAEDGGFLVNGELMVVAEVEVLEVIGSLGDALEELNEPLSKMKLDDGANSSCLLNKAQEPKESIEVNGFQVLPSQVESVRGIFEKHPDIAVEFHVENQHLRTTYMNFLLNIIATMCQSPKDLSLEDIVGVETALISLEDAGFKVDWLVEKLDQIKERKEKEQSGLAMLKEIEQQLHELKQKCEIKKSEVLSIGAPLNFDDVV